MEVSDRLISMYCSRLSSWSIILAGKMESRPLGGPKGTADISGGGGGGGGREWCNEDNGDIMGCDMMGGICDNGGASMKGLETGLRRISILLEVVVLAGDEDGSGTTEDEDTTCEG